MGLRDEAGEQDVQFRHPIAHAEQNLVRSQPRQIGEIVQRGDLGALNAANSGSAAIDALRPAFAPRQPNGEQPNWGQANWDWRRSPAFPAGSSPAFQAAAATAFAEPGQAAFDVGAPTADVRLEAQPPADLLDRPLGAARTQIHET